MRKQLLILLALALPLPAADKAPDWLKEMATRATPAYESGVPAVVLFQEERNAVDEKGKVTTFVRRAVKILTRDGRDEAVARVVYRTDTGKVRSLRAWMIYPSGAEKAYDKKETVDVALAANDVYNESRAKAILASGQADPGAVFGYESVSEDQSVFTQFSYQFQDELPALTTRFSLQLPAGWTTRAVTYNYDEIEPLVQDTTHTWQLENLAPISDEPAQPSITSLAPWLAVSYFPAAGASGLGPAFESWPGVSAWLSTLNDPQAEADGAIAARAASLVEDAPGELERIAAIGRFVQGIKYVSIQTGVGRGGGYRPHAAADVFQKGYGDCKDKANLMRAMLRSVGIESYPVAIFSGDRRFVRDNWPSPQQFNHAIIAVQVSGVIAAPAVGESPGLGRLLFFDPTDPHTPPGFLPEEQQDSWALLVDRERGDLVKTPAAPPEQNLLTRTARVKLAADGSIEVELREECLGQAASDNRSLYEQLSTAEYRRLIERWITRGAPGAQLTNLEAAEQPDGGFVLVVAFRAAGYGQSMGGQLLIFKPAIVSRRNSLYLKDETRKYPVRLGSVAYREKVHVELPESFRVDEKPLDLRHETGFGYYAASWEVAADGGLIFEREMQTRAEILPAEQYSSVREFYGAVLGAEQSPVVLVKH
jgi:transglutaminase-like putative cysteine protease